jgi:glycosyltransferase involved in cell wall biosynthesis
MNKEDAPQLSVVVPVFRGARFLDELHRRLSNTLASIHPHYEILFVDDCSVDDSWAILERIQRADPHVRTLRLMRNAGQQRALLAGLEHAKGAFVVTIDEDLQLQPEDIRILHSAIVETGADAVIGRYEKKQHGLLRGLATRIVKSFARITMGVPLDLDLTSFRIMRQPLVSEVVRLRNFTPVVGFMIYQLSRRIENVTVSHQPRVGDRSSYTFRSLLDFFLCMVIDYSDLPLRAVGYIGFGSATLAVGLSVHYLVLFARGLIGVRGFPTLVLISLLFFGLTLMTLGVIGTYLRRILERTNGSPLYVIRERHGFPTATTHG